MTAIRVLENNVKNSFSIVKGDLVTLRERVKMQEETIKKQDELLKQFFENEKQLLIRVRDLEKTRHVHS